MSLQACMITAAHAFSFCKCTNSLAGPETCYLLPYRFSLAATRSRPLIADYPTGLACPLQDMHLQAGIMFPISHDIVLVQMHDSDCNSSSFGIEQTISK